MQSPNDAILHSLNMASMLLHRYCDDLSPAEMLHRPTPKANCAAWLIGHLTLAERRGLAIFAVADLPPLPDGYEKRFSRDEGCPQASEFGDVSQLLPLYDRHHALLTDAVGRASLDQLNKPLDKPFPVAKSVGEMANFFALHAIMHAGQITIIRRSLGRPPVM